MTVKAKKGRVSMAINGIYGNTISMASKALDFLWTKESVISDNLANVETPAYKAKYVTFEEEFQRRLEAAGNGSARDVAKAIDASRCQINTSDEESSRVDGNNVNADVEIMELTRTSLQYQYLLRSDTSDITRLNTVIKGQ